MSYDLAETDRSKLVSSQKLKGAKKLTLRQTLMPKRVSSTQSYILADISGSMHGEKMDALKVALKKVWRGGIHGIAFSSQIYDFDEKDISSLRSESTTNMQDALLAAWDDKADHIILLTDGRPDQAEDTILFHVRLHQNTPIDTIGIGKGDYNFNEQFLRQISEITGGRFNSVNEPLLLSEVMADLLQISEVAQSTSGAIAL